MMQPMPRLPPFDRPATYDDLVKVPDIQVAEIVDGELHASPRPSTALLDRAKKLAIYAREGVAHAWIVDPLAGTLEVMRLENGRWTILAAHSGPVVVRAEPFADIDLDLSALWADTWARGPSLHTASGRAMLFRDGGTQAVRVIRVGGASQDHEAPEMVCRRGYAAW
jgi:hypothetical protein